MQDAITELRFCKLMENNWVHLQVLVWLLQHVPVNYIQRMHVPMEKPIIINSILKTFFEKQLIVIEFFVITDINHFQAIFSWSLTTSLDYKYTGNLVDIA